MDGIMDMNIKRLFNLLTAELTLWKAVLNDLISFYKEIIEQSYSYVEWLVRGVFPKKDSIYVPQKNSPEKRYFTRGMRVETRTGEQGKIWRIYRSIQTNEITGCTVIWDKEYKGESVSLLLPAEDKGIRFNPIIRQVIKFNS
jgi:hypothetical protein